MTYSLQIKNGDLSVSGPGGLATVTGQQKLVQDLRNWLLEPRGTDPMHPSYGSNLDGGALPDGTVSASIIGGLVTDEMIANIEAEIRRILNSYQQQQRDRLNDETARYGGKNTFGLGEILVSVDEVTVLQQTTTVFVKITVSTASGDQITFVQPINP